MPCVWCVVHVRTCLRCCATFRATAPGIHSFIHSSVAHKHARNVHALCDTKLNTLVAQSRHFSKRAWYAQPLLSPSILVTRWCGSVRPFFLCLPQLVPSPTSPSFSPCLPLSSCSSPSLCRCCGRASPLELLLMVFGAYSRMLLCTRSTGVLWLTPLQSGRCTLSGLLLVTASRRITRALDFSCPFLE